MGAGRKNETHTLAESERIPHFPGVNSSVPARNLRKRDLGGVIFGCKNYTMKECLSNLVFGLPEGHFSYIKNIEPGLPLFLFNYSDRTLHGIYEAAGHGKMNINPYGWTSNGSDATEFPAQVRVRIRKQCQSLSEEQFKKALHQNYSDDRRFHFELDHAQTGQLLSIFEKLPLTSPSTTFSYHSPMRKPCNGMVPNLGTRHEDKYLKTLEACSNHLYTESGLPAELPRPRKWVSLFQESSDSNARSEDGDRTLVSEANDWEEKLLVCLNESNMNLGPAGNATGWGEETCSSDVTHHWKEVTRPSGVTLFWEEEGRPSGITPCWEKETVGVTPWCEEEKQIAQMQSETCPSDDTHHWKEVTRPSGVTPFSEEEGGASGITPCWGEETEPTSATPWSEEEKQMAQTQSEEGAIEDEETRIYWKLKQLCLERENLNLKEHTEDVFVACGTNNLHLEDQCSPPAPSETGKENSEEDMEDTFLPCMTDGLNLEEEGSLATPSASEKGNSDSDEGTKDDLVPCATDNLHLEDESYRVTPSTSEKYGDVSIHSRASQSVIDQLMQEIKDVKTFSMDQHRQTSELEKKLADSDILLQDLSDRIMLLESHLQDPSTAGVEVCNHTSRGELLRESFKEPRLGIGELMFVMGGYDGAWLPTTDSYSPLGDIARSHKPMSSVRSYASAAVLNGHIFNFGGWNGYSTMWYDTVECYNPVSNEWISFPSLSAKKGCLAAASLNNRIYAIGGGNGIDCFKEVEMFVPELGRWIPTQSMLQKRFASTAAELDGVIYVVGGYDGKSYLKSGERYDPREASWSKLQNMNTSRGSHALTVFNGKLYALGGYDGNKYVPSVEVFDPCKGSWLACDEMNQSRGYFVAPVIGDTIYAIGGQGEANNIVDSVETYRLGHGWSVSKLRGIGKRCFFSAVLY